MKVALINSVPGLDMRIMNSIAYNSIFVLNYRINIQENPLNYLQKGQMRMT